MITIKIRIRNLLSVSYRISDNRSFTRAAPLAFGQSNRGRNFCLGSEFKVQRFKINRFSCITFHVLLLGFQGQPAPSFKFPVSNFEMKFHMSGASGLRPVRSRQKLLSGFRVQGSRFRGSRLSGSHPSRFTFYC